MELAPCYKRTKMSNLLRLLSILIALLTVTLATAVTYFNFERVRHLTTRIEQASGQIVALERVAIRLDDQLISLILNPDLKDTLQLLDAFERDAIHTFGVLDQLTEIEIGFVGEDEQNEEEAERQRPRELREALIEVLGHARQLIRLRGSADLGLDVSETLSLVVTSRQRIQALVQEAIEDERGEIERAHKTLETEQTRWSRLLFVLLFVAACSTVFGWLWQASMHAGFRKLLVESLMELRTDSEPQLSSIDLPDVDIRSAVVELRKALSDERTLSRTVQSDLKFELEHRSNALQLSNTRLKQIDETRRRFLTDLGHSLKTPLSVARGSIENIKNNEQEVPIALLAIDNVNQRISELLSLAQSDDGRLTSPRCVVELTELLDNRLAELRVLPNAEYISFSASDDGPFEIEGDRDGLVRLFDAIVENGLRFASESEPLEIKLGGADGFAVVSICDHGPGVLQGKSIFDRHTSFFSGGTGIGLSMANQIADQHKGNINFENTVNGGAEFTVRLPLLRSKNDCHDHPCC
ncbi:putative sensor histidine kinase [Roseibium sp. TrichSKD4]|nr:putative sensor histidine kinase [Roseibium sp. TrichSKD4]